MALVGGVVAVVVVVVVVVVQAVRRWTSDVVEEEVGCGNIRRKQLFLFRLMWRGRNVRRYLLVQFP
jgi:hypothetical protein